jgi:hypothetical protein
MRSTNRWHAKTGAVARRGLMLLLAIVFLTITAAPVMARDNDRYGHDRGRHRGHYRGYYRVAPAPVYPVHPPVYVAPPPPPVYYAPPPPPPGISLVFPIHIR